MISLARITCSSKLALFLKSITLIHRSLGIVLGLLFMVWFVSGIGMMFSHGMPALTAEARLQHLPPLDLSEVQLTPERALLGAGIGVDPGAQAVLLMVMGRPAYRYTGEESLTVFADTGERLLELGPAGMIRIAASFMNLPSSALHHVAVLNRPDKWTIGQFGSMPLYKIRVDDAAGTELYVSASRGEVVTVTTRRERMLSWISTIPHLLYISPLNGYRALWRVVLLLTSALGAVLALTGIGMAVASKLNALPSSSTCPRWTRWHSTSGLVFGIFAFTWALSGMLYMVTSRPEPGTGIAQRISSALAGGPVDLSAFPINAKMWDERFGQRSVKEIEFVRIQGDHYYLVRGLERMPLLVQAGRPVSSENLFDVLERGLEVKQAPFSIDGIMERVRAATSGVAIVASEVLSEYDSDYDSSEGVRPLPVLRIKFGDPEETWVYIDTWLNRIEVRQARLDRMAKLIHRRLHTLDFLFRSSNRSIWVICVVVLCIGGIVVTATGFYLGVRQRI
jgi:hypothetical protein